MCGITGFVGSNAAKNALEGLRTLEYRGYDSAGIGFFAKAKPIRIVKSVGDVSALEKKLSAEDMSAATCAITHTRWATHGGVSDANAHPHADCTGKVAIVHNGIVENFRQLKDELAMRGHKFASQTDTEVISHLIEENLKTMGFAQAARKAICRLEGSYAILAIHEDSPETMIAAKNQTPLVVSVGADFAFAASDPVPISAFAKQGVFFEDGDFAVIQKGKIELSEVKTGRAIKRDAIAFGSGAIFSDKQQYPHFMLKEIMETPKAIRLASVQDSAALANAAKLVNENRVVFVACGTSRHASLVGRYLFNRIGGKFCEVVVASEFPYIAKNMVGKDLCVIAVSQSGETADVIEGVKIAKANGAKVLSITNVVGSSLDRIADCSLFLNCGPEIGVAATKTFVAQLSIMYLLASACVGSADMECKKLIEVSKKIEEYLPEWDATAKKLSARLASEPAAYFIARGPNFPTALEGALKFKEITYIHAEGMAAGELKHGTLALISKGTPVIAICPHDFTFAESISNVMETKARGAFVIGCSDEENPAFDALIRIPKVEEHHFPIVFSIPLQFLAYHTSVLRKNNPDRPRNLAKSVTVK
ncbi:MAG: glutamine--fructose-6-phosphate transaminase (isomerizing) [Candidatus Micrarchaeia archaeon]|jgi:glucosamine--fructose-6-phosphate aminotransferase (isomerizing)